VLTQEWDIVLLLVATIAGYILGRTSGHREGKSEFSTDPSRLQSLIQWFDLHNESDIQNLLQKLEVTQETIETHLAIASMFRKKGEFTKSLAIHQNIFGRPAIDSEINLRVQFELACDFLSLGMMNRAESLFNELIDSHSSLKYRSIDKLVQIHDIEKDWESCVRIGEIFGRKIRHDQAKRLSHHYCELSLIAQKNNNFIESERFLKKALTHNNLNARVWLLKAYFEAEQGDYKSAYKILAKSANKSPGFLSEMLPMALKYAKEGGVEQKYNSLIDKLLEKYPLSSVQLARLELNHQQHPENPLDFFDLSHGKKPSKKVVTRLLGWYQQRTETSKTVPIIFDWLIVLLKQESRYQCNSCGFESSNHSWQCPQCKAWDSVQDREDRLQLANNDKIKL